MFSNYVEMRFFLIYLYLIVFYTFSNATDDDEDIPDVETLNKTGGPHKQNANNRIINGVNAKELEFPHQVSVRHQDRHTCGGTIYNETTIITAVHCVVNDERQPLATNLFKVAVGIYYRTPTENEKDTYQILKVHKIITHPCYSINAKFNHDIALLIVDKITFSEYAKPLRLPNYNEALPGDKYVYVIGWGHTNNGRSSDKLMKAQVNIMNHKECVQRFLKSNDIITKYMICAGGAGHERDSCSGDSGGPLLMIRNRRKCSDRYIFGIVSFGMDCADKDYPGVYVDISKYICWINDQQWTGNCTDDTDDTEDADCSGGKSENPCWISGKKDRKKASTAFKLRLTIISAIQLVTMLFISYIIKYLQS